jgi:ferredoxin
MKTTLYYFSATGNSLKVTKDLGSLLGNAEVVAIPREVKKTEIRSDADTVGIVFPVFAFGLPTMVAEFCRKLTAKSGAYVFGVMTYGGMPGATMYELRDVMAEKGITLAAGFGLQMPGNYTPLYGAPSPSSQQKQFDREKNQVREMAEIVKARQSAKLAASNGLVNFLFSTLMHKPSVTHFREADKKFFTTDKCNGCGTCAKVCPAGNVAMENRKPVWQHRCEQCMACLQWCPQEAIEFGKVTVGRRRYRHPDFTAKDFMLEQRNA